jgi:hypothetical protein
MGPVGFHGSVDGLCGFGEENQGAEAIPLPTYTSVFEVLAVSVQCGKSFLLSRENLFFTYKQ